MLTISRKSFSTTTDSPLVNIPFDLNKVTRVKLDTNRMINPSLWVIYLYARTKDKRERVARVWVYESEEAQFADFQRIIKQMSKKMLVPA